MEGEDIRLKYKVVIFIGFSNLVGGLVLECQKDF